MQKVLIANRGEIACRIIRACRTLNLATVAVHSEADAEGMHAGLADEAVAIGPGPARESYLDPARILAAAQQTGADAVHPGYGFLAENAEFAAAAMKAGLAWIGPTPKTIEDMGDKERARLLAKAAGVPVLPGSARFEPGHTDGILAAAKDVGFPLLVKAAAGGGGIGMRRVDRLEDLEAAVAATQGLAQKAFGDGTVYLERFVPTARHIEVQVFGFGDGRAIHAYERECSVQRRFQKIVEESAAPGFSDRQRQAMFDAAVALARQERYLGAGTIEFVVDASTQEFYFLEMNTRIQVEHPVTEMRTGLDLVAMQIALAAGASLPVNDQEGVKVVGHALECRIYAERPAKGFLPSPGLLTKFDTPPETEDLRIDTGVRGGDRIHHFYDPMIAKVITKGLDRAGAIARMLAALDQVAIEGVHTNIEFLRRIMQHPAFLAGDVQTDFVDRHKAALLA